MLEGPTALTLVHGDAALAAKALNDTARALNILEFKGGLLNGNALSADDVRSIARLPSRDVLQRAARRHDRRADHGARPDAQRADRGGWRFSCRRSPTKVWSAARRLPCDDSGAPRPPRRAPRASEPEAPAEPSAAEAPAEPREPEAAADA